MANISAATANPYLFPRLMRRDMDTCWGNPHPIMNGGINTHSAPDLRGRPPHLMASLRSRNMLMAPCRIFQINGRTTTYTAYAYLYITYMIL